MSSVAAPPTKTSSTFHVAGGAIPQGADCYVDRHADTQLFDSLLAGRYCAVLAPNQTGKTSLMIRTWARLRQQGSRSVFIYLPALGTNCTIEQWYNDFMERIAMGLSLEDELWEFKDRVEQLGPLHQWRLFLKTVCLRVDSRPLVIFLDEIGYVHSLPFSVAELFAAIQGLSHERQEDPSLERLTFCLLGSRSPHDLIRGGNTTPFYIDQQIQLTDFTLNDALILSQGLGASPHRSQQILKRVLHWTGGHPYLTQRLCQSVAANAHPSSRRDVDHLCNRLFLAAHIDEKDVHFTTTSERILESRRSVELLHLYQRTRRWHGVVHDPRDELQRELLLTGIVRSEGGRLRVRNRIYRRVFDRVWIRENIPDAVAKRERRVYRLGLRNAFVISGVILVLMVLLTLGIINQRNQARAEKERGEHLLYTSDMLAAGQAIDQGHWLRAWEHLERHSPKVEQIDLRNFEWYYYRDRIQHLMEHIIPHGDDVLAIAHIPGKQGIVTAGKEGLIRLWSDDDHVEWTLDAQRGAVHDVWSPGSSALLISSHGGTSENRKSNLIVWDTQHSQPRVIATGPFGMGVIALSPTGNQVAWGTSEGGILVFDWPVREKPLLEIRHGTEMVTALVYLADGAHLVSANVDGSLRIWDTTSGQPVDFGTDFLGVLDPMGVWSLALSPDGRRLFAGVGNDTLRIWNLQTGTSESKIHTARGKIRGFSFAPSGNLLAVAFADGSVRLLDSENLQAHTTVHGHSHSITAVEFGPDGRTLATASLDKTARILNLEDLELAKNSMKRHTKEIVALTYDVHTDRWLSGGKDGILNLWNHETLDKLDTWTDGNETVSDILVMERGTRILSAHADNRIRVWNVTHGTCIDRLDSGVDALTWMHMSSNSRYLVAGGDTPRIVVRNTHNLSIHQTLTSSLAKTTGILIPNTNDLVLVSIDDVGLETWDVETGRRTKHMNAGPPEMNGTTVIAVSPQGTTLAVAGLDRSIYLIDWPTGKPTGRLVGHTLRIQALAFSPDGSRLASGGLDYRVKLWDPETNQEVIDSDTSGAPITALAFSERGDSLAVGAEDGSIVWLSAPGNDE